MLEARLLVKLVEAKTLWTTPPYYTNDAQDIIREAVAMAADSPWEDKLDDILPEVVSYAELRRLSFQDPTMTEDRFTKLCSTEDKRWNDIVKANLNFTIEYLCQAIGDKVHRRNLQIADLKQLLEDAKRQARKGTTP